MVGNVFSTVNFSTKSRHCFRNFQLHGCGGMPLKRHMVKFWKFFFVFCTYDVPSFFSKSSNKFCAFCPLNGIETFGLKQNIYILCIMKFTTVKNFIFKGYIGFEVWFCPYRRVRKILGKKNELMPWHSL